MPPSVRVVFEKSNVEFCWHVGDRGNFVRRGRAGKQIGRGITNNDGQITDLLQAGSLNSGDYRICFDTGFYFKSNRVENFYPRVTVEFEINNISQQYHVPLPLSPFGYLTYRGT